MLFFDQVKQFYNRAPTVTIGGMTLGAFAWAFGAAIAEAAVETVQAPETKQLFLCWCLNSWIYFEADNPDADIVAARRLPRGGYIFEEGSCGYKEFQPIPSNSRCLDLCHANGDTRSPEEVSLVQNTLVEGQYGCG